MTNEQRGLAGWIGVLLQFIGGAVAFLLVLALGALLLAAGVHGVVNDSGDYEPVEATALGARSSISRGDPTTSGRNSWSVAVAITYRYEIDGTTFPGEGRLALGRATSPSEAEQRAAVIVIRHRPGARVQVFVDPADPSRSVLERKAKAHAVPALAFGALFLVTSVVMAGASLRDWWRRRRGVELDAKPENRRIERWLGGSAAIVLIVIALSSFVIGIEREPATWAVLLGLLAVIFGAMLRDRLRRGRGD